MTRTTLLELLAHPATLTGADVRALEQLAQAFPYCQTAHLLLAKAAHDQGSMLASQRLRRAATYATDRARLRQLVELVPTPAAEPAEPELVLVDEPALAATEAASAVEVPEQLPLPEEPAEVPVALEEVEPVALEEVEPVVLEEVEPVALPIPELPSPPTEPTEEEELPAQAPPIRPPAEAALAHAEFGLAEAEPAEITAYRLPELAEVPELQLPLGITIDVLSMALPAFRGVLDVGYAPSEGSRLGFGLQGLTTEYSLTTGPAALLPSTPLPPANEFFAPDALVLAHLANHHPPTATPGARDLIDSFLRRSPQGTPRRRTLPPPLGAPTEAQPDLAGSSTRALPDLASENLAQILVRQGKPDRAIAIYERLMVKHPEKMAYFASQIDSLRPSA